MGEVRKQSPAAVAALQGREGGDPAASSKADANEVMEGPESDFLSEPLDFERPIEELYEMVEDPIGEGTYGTVWRARCRRTGQDVALKRLKMKQERWQADGFPRNAVREMVALQRLRHQNIVALLDVHAAVPATNQDVYMVFEYAPSDLTGLMNYRKKLKVPETKCIFRELLNGLDFCHMNGVMHRDLKPSNVLIAANGVVKLCDFASREASSDQGQAHTHNRPPELLLGNTRYDESVDIWSAACILGEMVLGRPLFPGKVEAAVLQLICRRFNALDEEAWPEKLRDLPNWKKHWRSLSASLGRGPREEDLWESLQK
eukprot:CAMPEP_0178394548 /NCGR_PEP_ID=MMETSP0689_2-20121128/12764_1 /TAXON_ID=160604 /ORGANISM="Amphidinium massartii, Strain CS-259" /LENGTH=316 /DNA_ID=CAMNT_0020015183 /DNA_START=1 /DNA_END=949 /DNA_ORIENTATION=-